MPVYCILHPNCHGTASMIVSNAGVNVRAVMMHSINEFG